MARIDEQEILDNVAVEVHRQMFGDAEGAKLAADLYKLRRAAMTAAPSTFAGFPRWAIAALAVWLALLETADKLPRLLLAYPGYEATLAEFNAKMLQPDLVQAQLDKAKNDASASAYLPDTALAQRDKAKNEAKASEFMQPSALAQLEKARSEARAAEWQPLLTAAQGLETEGRFMANGNLASGYTESMSRVMGRLKPLD